MTMLKALPSITVGSTGAGTAVKLGETPWFPGGNAILRFGAAPAGAVVLEMQGSADGSTGWTTFQSLVAADMADLAVELSPLPKYIRTNITTAGTAATVALSLEGVQ